MIRILNGEQKGVFPFLIRLILLPFEILYFLGVSAKLLSYKLKIFKQKKVDNIKIVCVGNISAGGTGKTPTVLYLLQKLINDKKKIAVVSRGYKRSKDDEFNDEGSMIQQKFPEVLQFQNPDRFTACIQAKEAGANLIILDDGFSHIKLARDVDLVLIDATRPLSNFELLPRGLLREPLFSLKRASLIVITRSDQVSEERLAKLKRVISKYVNNECKIILAKHEPGSLHNVFDDTSAGISEFKGKSVIAFAGIGNPSSFRNTCEDLGMSINAFLEFSDHHIYTQADIDEVSNKAKQTNSEIIVTTSKDAVKLSRLKHDHTIPMYYLEIQFSVNQEDEGYLKKLILD